MKERLGKQWKEAERFLNNLDEKDIIHEESEKQLADEIKKAVNKQQEKFKNQWDEALQAGINDYNFKKDPDNVRLAYAQKEKDPVNISPNIKEKLKKLYPDSL